jgi:hypothetical protein
MTIIWDLPEKLFSFVASYGPTPERGTLAALAVSLYRERKLSTAELGDALGFDIGELPAFLKQHRIPFEDQTAQDPNSTPREDR